MVAAFLPWVNLLNGKYLVVPKPLELKLAQFPLRFESERFRLYENLRALPWFYLAPAAEVHKDGPAVLGRLRSGQVDPQRVVLLERGCVASGPTGQSGAMIRPLFDQRVYVELVIASTRMLEHWDQIVGGDAGFVQQGFLRITNSLDRAEIGGDLALTRMLGEPVEILDTAQLAELVPMATFRDGELGILFPRGGYADPYQATVDLAAGAVRHGAQILEETQVTGLRTKSGRMTGVETTDGLIATSVVVNCAGPWSDRIARMAGVDVPIEVQPAPTCLFRRPQEMATVGPVPSDGVHQVRSLIPI